MVQRKVTKSFMHDILINCRDADRKEVQEGSFCRAVAGEVAVGLFSPWPGGGWFSMAARSQHWLVDGSGKSSTAAHGTQTAPPQPE